MNDFVRWQQRAIGTPFHPFGRDFDGWDCYAVLLSAYKEILNIQCPDFSDYSIRNFKQLATLFKHRSDSFWKRVDKPGPMVSVCIFRRGLPIHAAICINAREAIHVEEGIETCIEELRAFRIEGFYVPSSCSAAPL